MKRSLARLATVLLVAPLAVTAVAGAAAATESVTVPGCYGAGGEVVCSPTVTFPVPYTTEFYEATHVPVCAVTCEDVAVALVRPVATGEQLRVCATWGDGSGTTNSACTKDPVPHALDPLRADLAAQVELAAQVVCTATTIADCTPLVEDLLYTVAELIRG